MAIKDIEIEGLRFCPICGHIPVLQRNSKKAFRVKCIKCSSKTDWTTKTDAVIRWYNNCEKYEEITSKTIKE